MDKIEISIPVTSNHIDPDFYSIITDPILGLDKHTKNIARIRAGLVTFRNELSALARNLQDLQIRGRVIMVSAAHQYKVWLGDGAEMVDGVYLINSEGKTFPMEWHHKLQSLDYTLNLDEEPSTLSSAMKATVVALQCKVLRRMAQAHTSDYLHSVTFIQTPIIHLQQINKFMSINASVKFNVMSNVLENLSVLGRVD